MGKQVRQGHVTARPADKELLRAELGLDRPILEQYGFIILLVVFFLPPGGLGFGNWHTGPGGGQPAIASLSAGGSRNDPSVDGGMSIAARTALSGSSP